MRRFSRLVLLVLVAIVIGVYPLLATTPHRIDQAHFDLIQVGMTRADVEAIFGVPPGQYDWAEPDSYLLNVRLLRALDEARVVQDSRATVGIRFLRSLETGESWASRHGAFTVQFDSRDRVLSRGGDHGVRIVPPWQRWWKAIRGE